MKIIGYLVAFFFTIHTNGQSNCDLKKQADGINVFTCKNKDEKFKTLKAEFIVKNTTISDLKTILLGVDNYPTWQYNMIDAELLQKKSDSEIIYLSHVNAPWPVDDRELLVNLKINHEMNSNVMEVDMQSIEKPSTVKEGFVRVPFLRGHWKVMSDNDSLHVEYVLQIDPGGSIPAWLVNMAMAEGPYVSFKNLKQQLEK